MKPRTSSVFVGLFVLGALALAIVGVISFGRVGFWRETERFVIYFDESVHGLDRGSSVKLLGVMVGRVVDVRVIYTEGIGAVAKAICEIDRSLVVDHDGREIDIRRRENLDRFVAGGLTAQLNLEGITGLLFIEMDFFDPRHQNAFQLPHQEMAVVPSVRSRLADMTDNLTRIVRQLEEIDFQGIGDGVMRFLNTANDALAQARVQELVERMTAAIDSVTELARSEQLHSAIASANRGFEDLGRLSRRLEEQVAPLTEDLMASSEEVRETLREISETFTMVQELLEPRMGLGPQVSEAIGSFQEAARSVQRLADFLERHPQAIIGGRRN